MEKYWQRLLVKWLLIFIPIGIQILAFIKIKFLSFIVLPFVIYNIVKIFNYKVKK